MTAVELNERAARALRRAGPPVRVLWSLPAALPDLRPAGRGIGRPARPDPHHAAARRPAISPSRRLASRSIAASAAAPARPPARLACTTAELLEIARDGGAQTPSLQVRTLLSFVERPRLLSLMLRAGRPLAGLMPGPAGRSGRSLDSHASVTWERRRPGGPPAVVLRGCVMREAFAGVQQAAVDSLAAAGYDVVAGPEQGCCGALHLHNGELATGEGMREALLQGLPAGAILVSTAGRLRRRAARARRARARSQRGARASAQPAAGQRRRAPSRCSTPAISCTPRACARRRATSCAERATSRSSSREPGAAAVPRRATPSRSRSSRSSSRAAASRRSAPAAHASSAAATRAARCSCARRCARRSSTCASRIPPSSPSRRPLSRQ